MSVCVVKHLCNTSLHIYILNRCYGSNVCANVQTLISIITVFVENWKILLENIIGKYYYVQWSNSLPLQKN